MSDPNLAELGFSGLQPQVCKVAHRLPGFLPLGLFLRDLDLSSIDPPPGIFTDLSGLCLNDSALWGPRLSQNDRGLNPRVTHAPWWVWTPSLHAGGWHRTAAGIRDLIVGKESNESTDPEPCSGSIFNQEAVCTLQGEVGPPALEVV